uniref:Uncharacterized protein n=1 Tax=Arundo donax TaxID=35708 RepID=A0A0A9QFR7_ARUDO
MVPTNFLLPFQHDQTNGNISFRFVISN